MSVNHMTPREIFLLCRFSGLCNRKQTNKTKTHSLLAHYSHIPASLVAQLLKKKKNLPANTEDVVLIPGLRRSPGEGNGNPLHYSCLRNPMDRGAWRPTGHGVAKSQTQLSD